MINGALLGEAFLGWSLLVFALLSLLTTPLMILYARRFQLLDEPGQRRSHSGVIPRGGGAAAALVTLLAVLYFHATQQWAWALIPPLFALGVVGWMDDHHPQTVRGRLLIQVGSAVWLCFCLAPMHWLSDYWQWNGGLYYGAALLVFIVAVLTVIWLVNLYNFMDGSHGLATGEAIFAGAGSFILLHESAPAAAYLGAILAACMLGFLPWNFPKPKIFMGDVASGTLGLCVAAMAMLAGPDWWPVPLLLSTTFIIDATFTLFHRMWCGEVWYQAHRQHVYQRLIQQGWSHQRVWLLYMLINWLFILPVASWGVESPQRLFLACLIIAIAVALAWILAMRSLVHAAQA
jgi:Fuc2NAc and GlcNAc transferase